MFNPYIVMVVTLPFSRAWHQCYEKRYIVILVLDFNSEAKTTCYMGIFLKRFHK